MENKRKFIITLFVCLLIVLFSFFKDEILEQIDLLINPLPEYMSEHVPSVVLEYVPEKKYYVEVKVPEEKVKAQIKDIKEGDRKERIGLRHEIKDINKKIKERPTASLYKQRGDMRFKEMYVYHDLTKAKEFVLDFIKASEKNPTDWESPALAGFGLTISGDFVRAEEYLNQSISRKPNAHAYFWLTDLLLKKQHYSAALKALTKAEKLFKSPDYKHLEIKFKNDDIRPFVYEIYDTTLDYYRSTIENSIYTLKKMLKENPNLKTNAVID